jgi:CRP-like cAMP-binding protein
MHLHLICFAPEESVYVKGDPAKHLYIIRRGIVGAHGRVLGTGNFFGEDVILRSSTRLWPVYCLTYLDVYTLAREDLYEILADGQFPTIQKSVRRAIMKLAFRRNVLTFLRSTDPEQLRAIASMAAAAASAATNAGNESESDGDSDVDSESDFNDVGTGTTTNVIISAGHLNKIGRIPRGEHRLNGLVDSYEGGSSGGGAVHMVPQTNPVVVGIGSGESFGKATSATTTPFDDDTSGEHLLLSPKLVPPQLRCGLCHLVAFSKPKLSPFKSGNIMYC